MVQEPEIKVWENLNQLNAKFAVLVEGSVEIAVVFKSFNTITATARTFIWSRSLTWRWRTRLLAILTGTRNATSEARARVDH